MFWSLYILHLNERLNVFFLQHLLDIIVTFTTCVCCFVWPYVHANIYAEAQWIMQWIVTSFFIYDVYRAAPHRFINYSANCLLISSAQSIKGEKTVKYSPSPFHRAWGSVYTYFVLSDQQSKTQRYIFTVIWNREKQ